MAYCLADYSRFIPPSHFLVDSSLNEWALANTIAYLGHGGATRRIAGAVFKTGVQVLSQTKNHGMLMSDEKWAQTHFFVYRCQMQQCVFVCPPRHIPLLVRWELTRNTMKSEFEVAFNEISQLRELSRDVVLEALRTALVSAYKRDVGLQAQHVEVNIDATSGRARIFVEKEVVDDVQDDRTEVLLEQARYFDPNANYGDMVMVQLEGTTKRFGRIAAQTAKQVVLQKIREAERKTLLDEYKDREGDLVHGTVQSINGGVVTISLGRAEAIMPKKEQIPGEKIKPHDKVRAYIVKVEDTNRGPQIVVSRSHRNMLRRLLEYEVPEIFNGQVEIKNIAREAVVVQSRGRGPSGRHRSGRRLRRPARYSHSEYRHRTPREDRRYRVEPEPRVVHRQGAQSGASLRRLFE
ncbi:MAG: transcription termination/antitermination protein NusA [Chloroflexi bacterium]|nr:transcription termination/antitermination protein NusA [Chloroflexota bacterium]